MEHERRYELLVIGGSAGALQTVMEITSAIRSTSGLSIIVVLHRKPSEDDVLVSLLAAKSDFEVKEVDDKDDLKPGYIFIAPPDYHVLIEKDRTLSLDDSEKVNFSRPSIDVTFESAAEIVGERLICVLLSGANADGVAGLVTAKEKGAFIVVQDPSDSEFPVMPQQAVDQVSVDMLLNQNNLNALMSILNVSR
ncbi:chemotaxis protein CheB [Chryseolinea sp. T2]|uniref:chemotaxis protein CheB n=1 Tax=Chryseolinea sp. T2 TaxID=3129255 RepID=UPI0030787277